MIAARIRIHKNVFSLCSLVFVLCSLFLLLPATAPAQTGGVKDARYYTQQAIQAYQAKDYAAYLENMKQANSLRPEHPTIMYNLAGAYALNGQKSEAVSWLGKVAAMGFIYDAAADEDFASIKASEEFQNLLKQFADNKATVHHSAEAFTLEEKGLVTESVAYDSVTEAFYVSSVHKRKIVRVDNHGLASDFSTAQDGLWSVLGMKVDAKRRLLWVASAAFPQMMNFTAGDKNHTGVFKYDLKTGKLIKKHLLPDTTKGHGFGDLAVHPSGDVYVTDSTTPAVYVISQKTEALTLYAAPDAFVSPQGLDFSADGKRLFMADYVRGLFVFDVETKTLKQLEHAENIPLLWIDGLYFYKGSLICIQNGANPQRVIRLTLDASMNRIERMDVIEANHPLADEPTLGVIVRDTFYFIANSQWSKVSEQGELAAADKLQKPLVLKTKL